MYSGVIEKDHLTTLITAHFIKRIFVYSISSQKIDIRNKKTKPEAIKKTFVEASKVVDKSSNVIN